MRTPAALLAASILSAASAPSQIPHPLAPAMLDGTNGFILEGAASPSGAGISVSGAGDVNGDGHADLLVGAATAANPGEPFAGRAYLLFGKASSPGSAGIFNLSGFTAAHGTMLRGADAGDFAGYNVSGVGDVNGDGYDDVLLGSRQAASQVGEAYLVFGRDAAAWDALGGLLNLAVLDDSDGVSMAGVALDEFVGSAVAGAGDFNGDGVADFLVGAYGKNSYAGEAYLVYGSESGIGLGGTLDFASLDGTNGTAIAAASTGDFVGRNVSGVGDVNGDGYDDIAVGASETSAGTVYVIFGKAAGLGVSGSFDLGGFGIADGVRIDGAAAENIASSTSGSSIRSAGDANGDGYGDILIGAPYAAPGGSSMAGRLYLVFGGPTIGSGGALALSSIDGTNGIRFDGAMAGGRAGRDAGSAGDVDGDGLFDILVGAPWSTVGGDAEAGLAYLIDASAFPPGSTEPFDLALFGSSHGARIDGTDPGDRLGTSVSTIGDLNRDGADDIVVGAFVAETGALALQNGQAYVVYGAVQTAAATYQSSARASAPGVQVRTAIGVTGDGRLTIPASRAWLTFDGGDDGGGNASRQQVTLTRSDSSISGLDGTLDVLWEIGSTRVGWSNALLQLQYTDGERGGITEDQIQLFHAAAAAGPWTEVTSSHIVEPEKNRVSADIPAFGFFALADVTAPTVALSSDVSPFTNASFDLEIAFSEPVAGFDAGDLTLSNATVSDFADAGGGTFTCTIDPVADGDVEVSLGAGVATDIAGNANLAAPSSIATSYDGTLPGIVLSSGVGTYTTGAFSVTATPSEPVVGFAGTDIAVTNGTVSNFTSNVFSFTFTVTPAGQGAVSVSVPADSATDAVGNGNDASNAIATIMDSVAPTRGVSVDLTQAGGTLNVGFTASDATSGVASTELYVRAPGDSSLQATGLTLGGTSGTFNYSASVDGAHWVGFRCIDNAGNDTGAPTLQSAIIQFNMVENSTYQHSIAFPGFYAFPMTDSHDLIINLSGAVSAGTVTVSRSFGDGAPTGLAGTQCIDQSWAIVPGGGFGFASASLTFYYDPASLGGFPESLIDTAWRDAGGTVTGFPATLNAVSNTATVMGVTGFSTWYLGNSAGLPVELDSYSVE